MESEYFCIGVITEPHGIKGEVKVYPTTDDPDRIADLDEIILRGGGKDRLVHPVSVRWQKDRLIIKFKEINDRNESEILRKYELYVTRENAVELGENEYYVQDLIGLDVYDEKDELIGRLDDVIRTGANDVYQIVKNDGNELLLPAISECVLNVDVENGRMTVHVMEGLE
ncbi:MAG: ribosome maturation factor RimM [Lachnospiraceae bacterium]|nr:ribosome maturation factor RimM [Lachnospiraceae bacterium]